MKLGQWPAPGRRMCIQRAPHRRPRGASAPVAGCFPFQLDVHGDEGGKSHKNAPTTAHMLAAVGGADRGSCKEGWYEADARDE